MKLLVTGASGTIGRRLVARLLKETDHTVFCLVRNTTNRARIPLGATIVEGNLFLIDSVYSVLEKVDAVIHLAAQMDFYPKDAASLYETNVMGTKNLVEACVKKRVRRFIYISSTEVIQPTKNSKHPADEESELGSVFDYGKSKILAERIVRETCANSGTDYVILRLCGIFNDTTNEFQVLWASSLGLFFFVPGAQGQSGRASFMHIDDAVDAIKLAITSPQAANQTYIIASDSMTYEDIIRTCNQELGRAQPFVYLPLPIVELMIRLVGPCLRPFFNKRFAFEPKTVQEMGVDRWYSSDKAAADLGWKPKFAMREALIDSIRKSLKRKRLRRWPISPLLVFVCFIILFVYAIIHLLLY